MNILLYLSLARLIVKSKLMELAKKKVYTYAVSKIKKYKLKLKLNSFAK